MKIVKIKKIKIKLFWKMIKRKINKKKTNQTNLKIIIKKTVIINKFLMMNKKK